MRARRRISHSYDLAGIVEAACFAPISVQSPNIFYGVCYPKRGMASRSASNLAGLIDSACTAAVCWVKAGELAQTVSVCPNKSMHAIRGVRSSDHLTSIVDRRSYAVVPTWQKSQILHATFFRPKESMSIRAVWVPRSAYNLSYRV